LNIIKSIHLIVTVKNPIPSKNNIYFIESFYFIWNLNPHSGSWPCQHSGNKTEGNNMCNDTLKMKTTQNSQAACPGDKHKCVGA